MSDPLLSEFTRIEIFGQRGSAWLTDSGDGFATLVPAAQDGAGLIEIAAESSARYAGVWLELRDDVMAASRNAGFSRVEVIDRHSVLDPDRARLLDGVRRMKATRIEIVSSVATSPYKESDFDEVLTVIRKVFEGHPENGNWTATDVRRRFSEPWFEADGLRLRTSGTRLIGFCWCKIHPDGVGEIYLLAVHPEFVGAGHGRELVVAGIDFLQRSGCEDLIVYSAVGNERAFNLYTSVGFITDRIERRLEILLN